MTTRSGFRLSWLRLTGPAVRPAQIDFEPGLNVIWGASETGKSFIFSCIDFMLGREAPPKKIAELDGYTTAWLAFTERSGKQRVLERGLQGGDFRLFAAQGREWTLSNPQLLHPEHDPTRTDTISHLLLSAAGIEDAIILSGVIKSATRQLSFRDIAHMTLIHEERIIAERTPIYPSGQHVKKTEEMATFTHLISGTDWSGVVANPDVKLEKATWRGKKELYEQLIEELKREAGEDPLSLEELEKAIAVNALKITEVSSKVEESSKVVAQAMGTRKNEWERAQKARSRLLVVEQLRDRFELLKKQYGSDLDRLRFISDGEFFLAQLGTPHCPLCGEVLADHTVDQLGEEANRASLQEAAAEEAKKIATNVRDLEKAQAALDVEQAVLDKEIRIRQEAFSNAEKAIRQELEPRLGANRKELAALVESRMKMLTQQFVQQRLAQMTTGQAALGREPKRRANPAKPSPNPAPAILRLFADEIAAILRAWRYLKEGGVDFDGEMDVVVAGEPRRNRGKGIRAVLHSAFTIAVMTHCDAQNLKHTGLVLLDSPLTSYKENDQYEVDEDIQIGFFRALSELPEHQQVIVFENKEPPAALLGAFRQIHFSGTAGVGRRGFIPDRKGAG
ncbi:ATP-binding protein [Sorangium sp. So ce362]|uniref:ATP-binding protein n=1 Tax=Sorangium sp. So ce362 TaxID=3133303 RepID=UPI003F5D6FC0